MNILLTVKFRPFKFPISLIYQDLIHRLHCGEKNNPLDFTTVNYLIAYS